MITGDFYRSVIGKCTRIIKHQYTHHTKRGIRGFVFYGEPGTGKTVCAKEIANQLKAEMVFRDCADIAAPRYGESEKAIKKVFDEASPHQRAIIIFDDADGLFITRSFGSKLETWYLSHINVLFHLLDEMDTSRYAVIMTTNRQDLLDKALMDRLYPIEFPPPAKEVLVDAAKSLCRELGLDGTAQIEIVKRISTGEGVRTFRDMEKKVYEVYVEKIGG